MFCHKFSFALGLCSAFPLVFRTQAHRLSGPAKSPNNVKPSTASRWAPMAERLCFCLPVLTFPFLVTLSQFSFIGMTLLQTWPTASRGISSSSFKRDPRLSPKSISSPGPWGQFGNGDVTGVAKSGKIARFSGSHRQRHSLPSGCLVRRTYADAAQATR